MNAAPNSVSTATERALGLLQDSSCFRGEVCSGLPCACAETLAGILGNAQPQPDRGVMEATAAQHFDLPKGKPAHFVRNGILETCQCLDCRDLAQDCPLCPGFSTPCGNSNCPQLRPDKHLWARIRKLEYDNEEAAAEIARLRGNAYTAKEPFNEALRTFFSWAMRNGPWDGCGLDGADLQDKAEHLGLIVKTKFDPARHDGHSEFKKGDDFYEFAPGLLVTSTEGK